ncbi:MAG: sulfatase-like hydrolase/transferase [Hoylesella enoeca]|uniref:sulfatase-like hydrolase/transferase n=1 Tax=Hoylesella enoeca TaxID=76123 RepID=UPI003FA0FE42
MKTLAWLGRIFSWPFYPVRINASFFAFMYTLGMICAWLTVPNTRGAHLYEHLYIELFVDLYVVCVVLALIPHRVRLWVKALLYVIFYATALVDVYCFVKFDSTLTPTMLLLVGETDGREAGEFLRAYLSADIMFSSVGFVVLLMLLHVAKVFAPRLQKHLSYRSKIFLKAYQQRLHSMLNRYQSLAGVLCVGLLIYGGFATAHNKSATWKLMSGGTIGAVEHTLTDRNHAILYTPISRLLFSVYANSLASQQIHQLIAAANKVRVDSCNYRSPTIVLIIGESYGRLHSQQYGYFMPTTPRQIRRETSGLLVKYTDVVSPWNLTSFVFKNVFSMRVIGQPGQWCDYPLFPELFRKAGYHVTFLTNQFLPKAKEAVYDFSGGFFLNNPTLSKAQFDTRNDSLHAYDDGLLRDYDRVKGQNNAYNLIIFHLIGQHVQYRTRYPSDRRRFRAEDYDEKRPELNGKQKRILADYDNAVLYNDSIVDQICRRFEHQDAVVIYMPDHGEECYEGTRGFICRNHSAQIDYDLARYEFEIPFWIWCSHKYAVHHPEVFREIVMARRRRLMTDAVPHLLVYLAGIHAPAYHDEYNVLSSKYVERRPRLLKGRVNYDELKPQPMLSPNFSKGKEYSR